MKSFKSLLPWLDNTVRQYILIHIYTSNYQSYIWNRLVNGVACLNQLKQLELKAYLTRVTNGDAAVLPAFLFIHCVTPWSFRLVVWVTAVVIGICQWWIWKTACFVIAMLVGCLLVPSLTITATDCLLDGAFIILPQTRWTTFLDVCNNK